MKKIPILTFIFLFIISSSVQASQWPYEFVVWDGKVYEVKKEERIKKSEIGRSIGKVKTQPYSDTRTSLMFYYGNASFPYPIGTRYFEIKGIPTSTSIAVKVDDYWVKADYARKAPYHVMNTITNLFIIVPIVIIPFILIGFVYRVKKLKKHMVET